MSKQLIKGSLGEIIAQELRQNIWDQEYKFGERLIESDLSEKFNVSRNVIRDALKILEYEEIVINKPRKGTYVSEFTKKDWHEIIELRTMVESFAFVKAIEFLEDKHIEDLKQILEEIKVQAEKKNWAGLFDLDLKFHSYVVNLSDNSKVIKIYESIQVQIRTFLIQLDDYYSSHESFYEEQKELLDTLMTKDPKAIEKKIKTHIEYVEDQFLKEI